MSNKKQLVLYAGVNGSGKTTLHKMSKVESFRINPDEVIIEMSGDWKNSADQFKSAKQCLLKQRECFENELSFHRESTLCSKEIMKSIKKALDLNYHVIILFVGLSTVELAKERVAIRVRNGGHGIDELLIEKRFIKSKENIVSIAKNYSNNSNSNCEIYFYDNSQNNIFLSASYIKGNFTEYNMVDWVEDLKNEIL